jgi:hypothetical protein
LCAPKPLERKHWVTVPGDQDLRCKIKMLSADDALLVTVSHPGHGWACAQIAACRRVIIVDTTALISKGTTLALLIKTRYIKIIHNNMVKKCI